MSITLVGLYAGELRTITESDFSSNELTQLKEMLDRRYNSARLKPRVMGAHSNGPLMPDHHSVLAERIRRMIDPPARQIDERRTELRRLNARLGFDKATEAIAAGHGAHYKHLLENWDADDIQATNEARKGRSLEYQGSPERRDSSFGHGPAGAEDSDRERGQGPSGEAGDRGLSDVPARLGFDGSGAGGSE